jgi:Flp pilus assembly protein TadD
MLVCAAAEGLIAMKRVSEALGVLDRLEQAFPRAIRPKQLRGLALARSGQTMKAQLVLGKLYAAGQTDPETLGILAGTWMDRYNQTGERVFLLKSRDLYRQAFEGTPSNYYTGINAASKSLLAGEKETAAQLTKRSVTRRIRTTTGRRRRSPRHSSSRKTSTKPPPFMVRRFWRRRLTAAVTSRATLRRNSCLRR